MPYSREYFRLNFLFAERAAELARISRPDALFLCTHLYRSFRLGNSFDPNHPIWLE